MGTFLICYALISNVRGSFRDRVKKGLFGSFNCPGVNVLSNVVTAGNLSILLPTMLLTQYETLILLSYRIRF